MHKIYGQGNYGTIFSLIIVAGFFLLMFGAIFVTKCTVPALNPSTSDIEAGGTDFFKTFAAFTSSLTDPNCLAVLGVGSLVFIAIMVVLALTIISHIPFFGRGG